MIYWLRQLFRRRETVHIYLPPGQDVAAFTTEDGFKAGTRIIVHFSHE